MIKIRYSAPYDLDISGTTDELRFVQREILKLIQSDASQVALAADASIDPAPYNKTLSKLIVLKGQCPTKVSLTNELEMQVEGSPENLEKFAANIGAAAYSGSHVHYEHWEGNKWIDSDSIPLVISVKKVVSAEDDI